MISASGHCFEEGAEKERKNGVERKPTTKNERNSGDFEVPRPFLLTQRHVHC